MEELRLRGYVTPDDIKEGNDTKKLQEALLLSAREDICKVVIDRDLTIEKNVKIPAGMELKFADGVTVTMAKGTFLENEVFGDASKASWSFEDKWIYLVTDGKAVIKGDIRFFHAGNIVIEDMTVCGSISFEFCREIRMERNTVLSDSENAVTLLRGCNNFIVQYNRMEAKTNAILIDASLSEGDYVMGKDADIHEIILRDNELQAKTALFAGASKENGVFNVQYDHTKTTGTGIEIGHPGEVLDKKRYFNISAMEFVSCGEEKVLHNEVKHCYFG